ncbi:hypothetical protein ABIC09_004747 [Bradyrhizobium sp. S3.12.5]|uniref:hypothetical protein n=1 Tax=Bradyrhizobium sp. S3.12.5 TaxID=3156386 RepID=UPI0033933F6D
MALPPTRALDYEKVWVGAKADLRMSPGVATEYRQAIEKEDELSLKRKTHLQRYFKEFCDHDDYGRRLSDQKFKKEGNFPDGLGGSVAIYTFKAWKWRVYGAVMGVGGRRSFVGVGVDPDKKQDKADRAKLRAAAKAIAQLAEYHS